MAHEDLEAELKRVSLALGERAPHGVRRRPAPVTGTKSFSLVPVQGAHSVPLRGQPRPSDLALLRAYDESPWLHIKVFRLASSFASLPFKVAAEQVSGKLVDVPRSHPLWFLLENPNPMLSGWDFRFLSELYLRTVGQCYWHLRGNGLSREVWLYPSNWVQPVFGQGGPQNIRGRNVVGYRVTMVVTGGVEILDVPIQQMLWLRVPDPVEPYSRAVGDALSLASEIDTFELASESDRRFFENDASPPGALVVPGRMDQDEKDRMLDTWNQKQGGPANQGNTAVLFGGMDYKTFRQGRKEMDFVDGQRYLRDVIIAGVHKHVLGITEDVNFAAAKAADYQVSRWELAPRIPMWQSNMRFIASLYDKRLRVVWENPVPADEQLELTKANEGLLRGAITRAEWRATNKYEPLPPELGNVFIIPPGLIVVPMDEGGDVNATEPEEVPPEPAPEGGAPEKVADLKVGNQKASPVGPGPVAQPGDPSKIKVKAPAFDPLHHDWHKILQAMKDSINTEDTMDVLLPIYEAVMDSRIADAKEELGVDVGLAINDPTLLSYLRDVAGARIRNVDEGTRETIRDQLAEGIRAGETRQELEERLTNVFGIATSQRAEVIARTETIDASNATAYAAYDRSGVVEQVEWLLAPDYLDDDDDGLCAEIAESGPVPIGAEFVAGIAWPPAHPNCRCAVAPIVAEDVDKEIVTDHLETTAQDQGRVKYDEDYARTAAQGEGLAVTGKGREAARETIEKFLNNLREIDKQLGTEAETQASAIRTFKRDEARVAAFQQWAKSEIWPQMEQIAREIAKDNVRPEMNGVRLGGIEVGGNRLAYYDAWLERNVVIPRENILEAVKFIEQRTVDSEYRIWRVDTVFHEMGHALMDGFNPEAYHTSPYVIEGLNQQLGNKFTQTYLESAGIELNRDARAFLTMAEAETSNYSYHGAYHNMRNLFFEAGINVNDERVLLRALHSFTSNFGDVPVATRYSDVYNEFKKELRARNITEQNWSTAFAHADSKNKRSRDAISKLLQGVEPVHD